MRIHTFRALVFLLITLCNSLLAQDAFVPLNPEYYHMIDRAEVLNRDFSPYLHSTFKPFCRADVSRTMDSLAQNETNKSYILLDNWEHARSNDPNSKKPFLKKFYRTKADIFHLDQEKFLLKVSPVLYLSAGIDDNNDTNPIINTRGGEIRGSIDEKVGFYAFIGENQAVFPSYVTDQVYGNGALPNEAFWKRYGDNGGVDFFTARGYVTFQATEHIGVQFGHDKNFIGNGYRSMLLSDFAAPSTFLKLQTKIWRIEYTNLFTELVADAPFSTDGSNGTAAFPKKFMTAHHLSINVTDNFNIGLFETIIFNRVDSTSTSIEWNYMNPIIFYRSIEQYTGSPDNALFGLDFRWNIVPGLQLYGQGLLDELSAAELRAGNGWWGNKYALQLGGKNYNALGIDNLDLQAEFNFARPFTYSHESIFTSYSHYRQPLAHPLGANFSELVMIGRYQPIPKLYLTGKFISAKYGTDPDPLTSYGGDVLKDYNLRLDEYNHSNQQGVSNDLLQVDLTASYMLKQNLFIDLRHIYRDRKSDDPSLNLTTNFSSLALRLNIAARDFGY